MAIGDDEARRVPLGIAERVRPRFLRVELAPAPRGVGARQQPGHRQARVGGIADPSVAVGVSELHDLDEEVQVLRGVERIVLEVESFEHVEPEQRGQPLGRRRRLVDPHATIHRRDGLAPLAGMFREILGRQEPLALQSARDRLGHAPPVEGVGPVRGDLGECAGKVRRAAASRREDAVPFGVRRHRGVLANHLAHERGRRKAVGGVVDRRLEELAERPGSEPLEQHPPRAHAAGHADRGWTDDRQPIHAAATQLVEARPRS